jgi:hypothetical protein
MTKLILVTQKIIIIIIIAGYMITTAWRVLRLRMEEMPSSFGE